MNTYSARFSVVCKYEMTEALPDCECVYQVSHFKQHITPFQYSTAKTIYAYTSTSIFVAPYLLKNVIANLFGLYQTKGGLIPIYFRYLAIAIIHLY